MNESQSGAQAPQKTGRKLCIVQDEVKLRHTTHWDMDYLSRDELDAMMRKPAGPIPAPVSEQTRLTPSEPTPAVAPESDADTGWQRALPAWLRRRMR